MATLEQIAAALAKADAAGNVEDARALAIAYRQMQGQQAAQAAPAAPPSLDPYFADLPVPGYESPQPPEQQPSNDPAIPSAAQIIPQGLSGLNEGAAATLSLPNTIEMGLRSIGPAIGNAMGGNFAMPTESWLPDAGARFTQAADSIGAIKPETDDPAGQFARRVGQEVGAVAPLALGTPAKLATMASAAGSGIGAAGMQAMFPDNATAELIGQMIGGGSVLMGANALERAAIKKAAPSVEELRAQAAGLYDAARSSGVTFPQATVKSAVDDITARAISEGLDATLHPGATAALRRLQAAAQTGMTAQDAQTLRRVIGGAAGSPTNPDQARIAGIMKRMFDTQITSAIPELAPANALFSQAKKGQMIEDAFTRARDTLGVNYNTAGMVTALRREFKRIIDNPKTARGLTDAETDAIRAFVRGGPLENALRWAGRFAPTGVFPMASTVGSGAGLGFLAGNPTAGAVVTGGLGGAGMLARGAGSAMAMNTADEIGAMLRGGSGPIPAIAPNTASAATALGIGQAANQNDPVTQEIIRMLVAGQKP